MTSSGNQDGFIASYTSTGAYRWARRIGGSFLDEVNDIAVDERGNVSVTGTVFGNVTYNGGSFTTNGGSQDAFIANISGAGTFQWAHPLGGAGANDEGRTITMDKCGQIFVGGNFCSTADFDPGPGTSNLTGPPCGFAPANNTYFLASYDINGNYRWAEGGNAASGRSEVWGIDLDLCNSLIAVGGYNQTQDFDITSGTQNLVPAGSYDAFVSKHFLPKIIVDSSHYTSLGRAINCANNHIGRDSIVFCLQGTGPHVFNPWPALPYIIDDYTIINGKSQPGWSMGNIIVDGSSHSATTYGFRFNNSDYGEILGLSVRDFPNHGIYAYNADHVNIQDSHVGGNGQDGIRFYNSADGIVQGSVVGLNPVATASDPNGRDGIATNGTADNIQIGGTNPSEMNIIAGNTRYGIYFRSDNNIVEGNLIGTNSVGDYGNGDNGVYIEGISNRIGGTGANEANIIAFNDGHGIEIENDAANIQNHFWGNEYYCNTLTAIEINAGNQGIAPPVINLAAANGLFGTGVPGSYIEVYAPDSSGCVGAGCQGRYLLGTSTVDGTGNWVLIGSFNPGQQCVALQTDANLNTSEFSTCETILGPLEVNEITLSAELVRNQVLLQWEYPQVNIPTSFFIEYSFDASTWESLDEKIAEAGASSSQMVTNPLGKGYMYYRVGQWLENGEFIYSNITQINIAQKPDILAYPNPASDFFQILTHETIDQLSISNMTGQMVMKKSEILSGEKLRISHLPKGLYMVRFRIDQLTYSQTITLK